MHKPNVDLILPCYNPLPNWTETIISSYQKLHQLAPQIHWNILLVNDGSTQTLTTAHIEQLKTAIPQFKYIHNPINKGKGFALRTGVQQSTSKFCIYTDVDFPYQEHNILTFYEALSRQKCAIAVGSKDADYYKNVPPIRIKISKFLRYLIRTFLRTSISDTQCGLKGFNQEGKEIFLQTSINRYLFDLEFIFLADRQPNIEMQAIPVRLKEGIVFSKPNWRILMTEGRNFLALLWRFWTSNQY